MPFSGSGTGIQNADDIFFSNISDGDTLQYDSGTAKWSNAAVDAASAISAHVGQADPHTQYVTDSEHAAIDHTGIPGIVDSSKIYGTVIVTNIEPPAPSVGDIWVPEG